MLYSTNEMRNCINLNTIKNEMKNRNLFKGIVSKNKSKGSKIQKNSMVKSIESLLTTQHI